MIIVTRTTKTLLRQFFLMKSKRDLKEQLLILLFFSMRHSMKCALNMIQKKMQSTDSNQKLELYRVLIVRGDMVSALFNVGTTVLYA